MMICTSKITKSFSWHCTDVTYHVLHHQSILARVHDFKRVSNAIKYVCGKYIHRSPYFSQDISRILCLRLEVAAPTFMDSTVNKGT